MTYDVYEQRYGLDLMFITQSDYTYKWLPDYLQLTFNYWQTVELPPCDDNEILSQFRAHVMSETSKYGFCLVPVPAEWIKAWKEQINNRQRINRLVEYADRTPTPLEAPC